MKKYRVDCDITVSTHVSVFAESEEQALNEAEKLIEKDQYYYASKPDAVVGTVAVSANEEED